MARKADRPSEKHCITFQADEWDELMAYWERHKNEWKHLTDFTRTTILKEIRKPPRKRKR